MSEPKESLEGKGVDLEVSDIPAGPDMSAVVDILRKTYPDMAADKIVAQVIKILPQQGAGACPAPAAVPGCDESCE